MDAAGQTETTASITNERSNEHFYFYLFDVFSYVRVRKTRLREIFVATRGVPASAGGLRERLRADVRRLVLHFARKRLERASCRSPDGVGQARRRKKRRRARFAFFGSLAFNRCRT